MRSSNPRHSEQLSVERQWYAIRDSLLGQNSAGFDIERALVLAASCDHPEAQWLAKLFAGKETCDVTDAKTVFLEEKDDPRALGFAAVIEGGLARAHGDENWTPDEVLLRKSAELGFAFSQAQMVDRTEDRESFEFARKAAAQGERDGFYELGFCFRYGCECVDTSESQKNYLRAAELGHVAASIELGKYLDRSDPQKWVWWGLAAQTGGKNCSCFLYGFPHEVEAFKSGSGSSVVLFAIGRALHGQMDTTEKTIFFQRRNFESRVGPAIYAVNFYEAQLRLARSAVDAWTFVGIRSKIVKDIRVMVGKLVWEARNQAEYETVVVVDQ